MIALFSAACAPLINDITTVPGAPVPLLRNGKPLSYDPSFAEIQRRAYPDVVPLQLSLSVDQTLSSILSLLEEGVLAHDEEAGIEVRRDLVPGAIHLQYVAVTPLFRFRDDVGLTIEGATADGDGTGSKIQMRSRSRIGKGDLGANAKRIRKVFDRIQRRATKRER
jgi:hypothetical protein